MTTEQVSSRSASAEFAPGCTDTARGSFLSILEWEAVFEKFGSRPPVAYAGVSDTQLSVARHSGGAVVNGIGFTYIPRSDELIRDDVLRFVVALRRKHTTQQDQQQSLL